MSWAWSLIFLTHFHFIQNYSHAGCKVRIKCLWNSGFSHILFPRHCYCQIIGDMIISSSSQMEREGRYNSQRSLSCHSLHVFIYGLKQNSEPSWTSWFAIIPHIDSVPQGRVYTTQTTSIKWHWHKSHWNGIASKDMLFHCSYLQVILDYFLFHLLVHL